jgi:hypothetical protein
LKIDDFNQMVALKVSVNGEHLCTAGAEDLCVLNAIVNAVGALGRDTVREREDEDADLFLSVGGLTSRGDGADEHLRWTEHKILEAGDRIEILLVEVPEADDPVSKIARVPRAPDK